MKKAIVLVVITLIISIIYLSVYGFDLLINYANITFIIGAITFLIGCLSKISSLGGFSIFGYTSYYIGNIGRAKKYNDYNEYLEKREISRSSKKNNFVVYFIIGGVYIVVSIILNLIR